MRALAWSLVASMVAFGAASLLGSAEAADPVVGSGTGLQGYYFARNDFTKLHTIRVDPTVSFFWPGAPIAGMPNDNWGARWTGEVQAQRSEAYTFSVVADNAATVFIDGVAVSGPISMAAGERRAIRVDFIDGCCDASIQLRWQSPSTPPQVIPQSQLYPTPLATPVVGAGSGLLGYYFAASDFTRLGFTRVDATPTRFWSGSPGAPIGADNWAARWLGTVQAQYTETYFFYGDGDNAMSLWVNGQRLLTNVGAETRTVGVPMVAGQLYDVKIELVDGCCDASVSVKWESQSTPYQDLPTTQLTPAPAPTKLLGSGDGLLGYYFAANDFTRLGFTRVDATIDHFWSGSPGAPIGNDNWGARWIGTLEPQLTEGYRFYLDGDNAANLWVGDTLVLSQVAGEARTAPIPLVAGQRYPVKVELIDGCCDARVRLRWESPNTTLQVIPTTQLHSAPAPAPTVGSGSGLRGLYFATSDFTRLAFARVDPRIDHFWSGSPGAPIGHDNWGARWHGWVEPTQNESYRFYLSGDHWASLWIDGVKVLHQVGDQTRTAPIPLTVGRRHDIMVEMIDGCCDARVQLLWESPNTTLQVIPPAQLYPMPAPVPVPGIGDGLLGQYFATTSFTDLRHTRVDPRVDFFWPGAPIAGMPNDNWGARWTGQLLAPLSESYRFTLQGDNWASLWIDGALVLSQVDDARTAPIALTAGTWHDVRVDMVDGCCDARVSLIWESGNTTFGVVPQGYLSSGGFTFGVNETRVRERAGSLLVDVELSPAPTVATSVSYETVALSASGGSDFAHASGTLTFQPGDRRKSFLVPIVEDAVDEANETFRIDLFDATNEKLGRHRALNVTILDETPPVTTGLLQGLLGDGGWFVSPVDVVLNTSSVSSATIFWRLDPLGQFAAYDSPVRVGSEGSFRLEYYAVDDLGVEEIAKNLTFRIDLFAPTTSATLTGQEGNGGWWTSGVTATLSASDAASGVATTLARIDESPLAPYTGPLFASGTGLHALTMFSNDVAGLAEAPVDVTFRIDVTPPVSRATPSRAPNGAGWYNAAVDVALSATDVGSGSPTIAAALGDTPLAPYTGPITLATEGTHTIHFAATDLAGVAELPPRSTTLRLDLTAPLVSAQVEGVLRNGWYVDDVRVVLAGSDALSGRGAFQVASPTLTNNATVTLAGSTFDIDQDGTHVIDVRVLDLAGNAAPWLRLGPIQVDVTRPTIAQAISAQPGSNGWFRDTDASLSASAGDGAQGSGVALFEVSVDGAPYAEYAGAILIAGEGEHVVSLRATDIAGHVRTLAVPVRLDATAPSVDIQLDGFARPEDGTFSTSVRVVLTPSDATSRVPVNGVTHNAPGVVSTQRNFTLSSDGAYSLVVNVVDVAGNAASSARTFVIRHDVTPPITTSTAPTGWRTGLVHVGFTASDTETPIALTRVTIDGVATVVPGTGSLTRSFSLPVGGDGDHTIAFASEDMAGNVETARTATFRIDSQDPVTTIHVAESPIGAIGGVPTYADGVNVTLSAVDLGPSGLLRTEYRIGASTTWRSYEGEIIRLEGNGAHTLRARSVDVAGNIEGERTITVGVDGAAPVIETPRIPEPVAAVMPGDLPVFRTNVTIHLDAFDLPIVGGASAPVTVEWRLCAPCDGRAWTLYGGPIAIATEGQFTIEARVTDAAGHLSLATLTFVVDLSTPLFDLTVENADDVVDLGGVLYLTADLCLRIPAIDLPLLPDPDARPVVSALRNVSWIVLNSTNGVVHSGNAVLPLFQHYSVTVDIGCLEFPHDGEYRMRWGGCDGVGHCRVWGGNPFDDREYGYCECDWFRFSYDRERPDVSIVWPPPNSASLDAYTLPILPSEEECREAYRIAPAEPLAVLCGLLEDADAALAEHAPELRRDLRRTTLLAGQVPVLVHAFDEGSGVDDVELYVNGTLIGVANATNEKGYYAFVVNASEFAQQQEIMREHGVLAHADDQLAIRGEDERAMTFLWLDPPTEELPPLDIGLEPEPAGSAIGAGNEVVASIRGRGSAPWP